MVDVVILEGPDGAGKTTLYEKYFKVFGYECIHNGVYASPEEAYKAYREQQEKIRKKEKVVLDRSHISQAVYGPIYRKEDHLSLQHDIVDGVFHQMRAVVVLCYTKVAKDNWKSRKNMEYISQDHEYLQVFRAYDPRYIGRYTSLPVVVYDYTNVTGNEIVSLMDRILVIKENFYGHG